ncbi:MAG: hypothetical protein AB1467_00360 [Candidatus Diapherotrites archaeon]
MGKLLIIYRIYPEELEDVKLIEASLGEAVKGLGELKDVKRQPIAFGLELVRAGIVVPDKEEGLTEKIEERIKALKGVNQIEVEGMTLL